MIKLIKLELKKYKIGGYIKNAVIATIIISIIILFSMYITFKTGDKSFVNNFNDMTKIFIRCVFTIFAAVLISRFIIDEYTNKTINLMFMYPIKRKDIMIAKLIVIVIFTFTSMVVSNIFIHCSLYVFNLFTKYIDGNLLLYMNFNNFFNVVIDSALYSLVSLLPLYVGMKKKSSSSVIVTAIIITSLMNSGSKDFRLGAIIAIPCIIAVIGILVSYIFIKKVENEDVAN